MGLRIATAPAFLFALSLSLYAQHALQSGPVNAYTFNTNDIGDGVNKAIASCTVNGKPQCTIYVPPGTYSTGTTMNLNAYDHGTYSLKLDSGAVIHYTGSGAAIRSNLVGSNNASELIIEGGQLLGPGLSVPAQGIVLSATNQITVRDMYIGGFGNQAIFIAGSNTINIYNNDINTNYVGIYLQGASCNFSVQPASCSGVTSYGNSYAPNAVHIHHNNISANTFWAVFEDIDGVGATKHFNNVYSDNLFESNGSGSGGAINLQYSLGTQVTNNYFEANKRNAVLGNVDAANVAGVNFRGNYYTIAATDPPAVEIVAATDTLIDGNTANFLSPSSVCFLNVSNDSGTYLGKNHIPLGYGHNFCKGGQPGMTSGDYSFSAIF